MNEPNTHDYTKPRCGKDCTFNPIDGSGVKARMSGWGKGIRKGDYLLLQNGDTSTRYQVESIKYYADPPDMWRAEVIFAPRESDAEE